MDWQTIIPFMTATVLLLVMPGPVMTIVTHNTLRGGAMTGTATVIGVGLGRFLALAATFTGLIISGEAIPSAFQWLSLAGIGYLTWLAIRALRHCRRDRRSPPTVPSGRPFLDGLAVALSNPVTFVFYTAFFPQFIRPDHSIAMQATMLGAIFLSTSFSLELILVFVLKRLRQSSGYDASRFETFASVASAVAYILIVAVAALGLTRLSG